MTKAQLEEALKKAEAQVENLNGRLKAYKDIPLDIKETHEVALKVSRELREGLKLSKSVISDFEKQIKEACEKVDQEIAIPDFIPHLVSEYLSTKKSKEDAAKAYLEEIEALKKVIKEQEVVISTTGDNEANPVIGFLRSSLDLLEADMPEFIRTQDLSHIRRVASLLEVDEKKKAQKIAEAKAKAKEEAKVKKSTKKKS